ncbi:hypothetical protein, partial [Escherichia coli]|uniref:hypothetical protein n=1 Tax=Escherichia coli TaxID=562 RepID=UPI001A7E086C
ALLRRRESLYLRDHCEQIQKGLRLQRPRPRRSEFKSTSHANARAPNLTILKPQQKDTRNKNTTQAQHPAHPS